MKVDQLTLGPSTIKDLELPALREVDLGGDGLIGIDALVQQRLMMDFDKHVIKVEDARIPEKFDPSAIVITARRQRGQLILTHVKAAGLPLDAIIDTGSEITIGNLALRDKLIRNNRDKFVTVTAIGVTGAKAELQLAQDRRARPRPGDPARRADGLRRRAAVQDVRPVATSRRCCSAPTSSRTSAASRSTSARARCASSSAAATRR